MFLEIDEGFPEHPKTLQLCASLENPTAFAYVINFWRWACRSCQDGDLRGISVYAIEEAAKYHKHDGKLFAAMTAKLGPKTGFIDVDDSGLPARIHNWDKRTGAAIERMENEAERKRMYRAHKDGKCGHGCKWCQTEGANPKNVHGQSAGHPQDIPTQSSPVQSSPVKSSQGDSPARDLGTADTEAVVPPPDPDRPFLPDTPARLKCCLDAAMQKARPERCPYAPGQWWDREAGTLLRDIGTSEEIAREVLRRIGLFVKDDRMAPWTVKRFCAEYNGIGAARPVNSNGKQQANYGR